MTMPNDPLKGPSDAPEPSAPGNRIGDQPVSAQARARLTGRGGPTHVKFDIASLHAGLQEAEEYGSRRQTAQPEPHQADSYEPSEVEGILEKGWRRPSSPADAVLRMIGVDDAELTRVSVELRESLLELRHVRAASVPSSQPIGPAADAVQIPAAGREPSAVPLLLARAAGANRGVAVESPRRDRASQDEGETPERPLARIPTFTIPYVVHAEGGGERSILAESLLGLVSRTGILGHAGQIQLLDADGLRREKALAALGRIDPRSMLFVGAVTAVGLGAIEETASAPILFERLRSLPLFDLWYQGGRPEALFLLRLGSSDPEEELLAKVWQGDLGDLLAGWRGGSVRLGCYSDLEELRDLIEHGVTAWLLEKRRAVAMELGHAGDAAGFCQLPDHPTTCLCFSAFGSRSVPHLDLKARIETLERLWEQISSDVRLYRGTPLHRTLDVACFGFTGEERNERSVRAGVLVVQKAHAFPEGGLYTTGCADPGLRASVRDLSAAAAGSLDLEPLSFSLAMAERDVAASPGLVATATVVDRITDPLRSRFRPAGRFLGEDLWIYSDLAGESGWSGPVVPPPTVLKIELEALETALAEDAPAAVMSTRIARLYGSLERLQEHAQRLSGSSFPESSRFLAELLDRVIAAEARAWKALEPCASNRIAADAGSAWRGTLLLAAARRVPLLERLRELQKRLSHHGPAAPGDEPRDTNRWLRRLYAWVRGDEDGVFSVGLLDGLRQFARGDDIDAFAAFTDLTSSFKGELLLLLRRGSSSLQEDYVALKRRLWGFVDLVVAEDVSEQQQTALGVLPSVATGPLKDRRFTVLCDFLLHDHESTVWAPADALRSRQVGSTLEDEENLWRCLMVSHGGNSVRRMAARQIRLRTYWHLVAYPRTPVAVLASIVERLGEVGLDEYGQVCFECVYSRLSWALASGTMPPESLPAVGRIVYGFARFSFAVDTGYFDRLRLLLHLYKLQLQRSGLPDDSSQVWQEIERGRSSGRTGEAADVAQVVVSLPPAVQRHLASQGAYPELFVCHPDYRIAQETLRFLGPDNLPKILRYRSLNGRLFADLLRRSEMFRNPLTMELALNHPKCDSAFAARHLSELRPPQVLKIARNRSANPVVRKHAERLLNVRGFPDDRRPRSGSPTAIH